VAERAAKADVTEAADTGTTAVAPTDLPVPAVPDATSPAYRGVEGEWVARDQTIPFIALGQRTSAMAEEHPEFIGRFIYDKSESLGETLTVIVTNMRKYYLEAVEFGSAEIPARFSTAADVRAAGMDPENKDEVVSVGDVDILVRATSESQYERCTLVDEADTGYYPARMTLRSSALSAFSGVVWRDLRGGWLKGDLCAGYYKLVSTKKLNPKGHYYVPLARADGALTPAFRAKLRETFGI